MIVNISEAGSNAALDALGAMMNGGSIEMLSAEGNFLAKLKLSNPSTKPASGGEIEFNTISEGVAVTSGQLATARILSRNDQEIMLCDVGDANSDAVVKLSTTSINRGSPVRIDEFRLAMP